MAALGWQDLGGRESGRTWVAGSVAIHIRAQVCQKKHWKQHKKACSTKGGAQDERPFRIQEVAGKGLGMVATR